VANLLAQKGERKGEKKASFPVEEIGRDGLDFISGQIDAYPEGLNFMATVNSLNVRLYAPHRLGHLVNLARLNDIRHINKFLETVNERLEQEGLLIGVFESKEQRKARIFRKYPAVFAFLFYYLVDFSWKRILPKIPLLHKLYYGLTRGHNRVLTLPEVLGRLISCGFRIRDYKEGEELTYFCAEKAGEPHFDEDPSYGPLIRLTRIGRYGKDMEAYKFRTMHPYAEYLQEFIYEQNSLQQGGKFHKDFRITRWGGIMRRLWLDELPMLLNWLKGEVKLVGVRPLSRHYFELYPERFRQRRIEYKPGLIPPFYAHLPGSFEEILASEKKYLMDYDRAPFLTDITYLVLSLYNIIIKRARSA